MASRTAAGVPARLLPPGARPARSNAAKGSYYRGRTLTWLEAQGYAVAQLEQLAWIRRGGQPCAACGQPAMFATKRDQLGADLLAVRADAPVVFVQVKLGADQLMAARRKFAEFPFPPSAQRWVVIWEPRAREPRVVDCTADTPATLGPVRGRAATETLF